MSHFYSDSKKGFYLEELRDLYEAAGTWPEDAVQLTEEQYIELYNGLEGCKTQVAVDRKGNVKIVPLPAAEIKAIDSENERYWRNGELARADNMIRLAEDGEGVGTVADWREYRKSLRKWPEHKSFPKESARPVAPDA